MLITAMACGGGGGSTLPPSPLSGNWEVTLVRHNSTDSWTFSGFLLQSGKSVTGSLILGAGVGCQGGVGPVNGTFDGQNLQLTVGSLGQDFGLSGSVTSAPSGRSTMEGQFSALSGGCLGFSSTGTFSAVRIPPLSGPFHGSFVEAGVLNPVPQNVTGTLTQGSNIGASTATLSGNFSLTGSPQFCSYLSTGTLMGTITGTNVVLDVYGPDGSQIGYIAGPNYPPQTATLAPNGGALNGSYSLNALSTSCTTNNGAVTMTFP